MMTPLQSASRVGWSEDRLHKLRQMCRLAGIQYVFFSFTGLYESKPVPKNGRGHFNIGVWGVLTIQWNTSTGLWVYPPVVYGQGEENPPPENIRSLMRLNTDVPGGDW